MSEYSTAEEVAARWRVDPGTIRAWARARGLPHVRVGQALRFRLEEVEAWLEQQQGPRPRRRTEEAVP